MSLALRVFFPFAVAYLLAYILRVVNAVAGEPIAGELGLSAADLGFLTSVYFFGFALCQIPLGLMMDRYGPRRVEGISLMLAAAGCGLFSIASDFGELVAGRALMGVGASMCLMAPFTAYRVWFPAARMPMVVGFHMAFGAMGAGIGGGPTEALMETIGWRGIFVVLSGLVVAAGLGILIVVPRQKEPRGGVAMRQMTRELATILTSGELWRIAPLSASTQVGYLAVVSLWTGPWLRHVAGHSPSSAALWLSIASSGLIIGFLVFGSIGSWAHKRGRSLDVILGCGFAYALTLLGIIMLPPEIGTYLWILFTVTGTGGILSYALVSRAFPASMAGRVNTALNCIVFLSAFALQWAFGVILTFFPDGAGGIAPAGYNTAFGAMLVIQLVTFIPILTDYRRLAAMAVH